MPVTILVGAQWGDEGKGKVADWLAEDAAIIARFNGGDNAGHTLNVDGITYKLHFIPSGILREGVVSVMGGGMVIHPERLLDEMQTLADQGVKISPERLKLASNAHIITPAHQALETAAEIARGAGKIGTTGRGIGPTYASKAARDGIRAASMADPESFGERVRAFVETTNRTLKGVYDAQALDADEIAARYCDAARKLAPYLVNVSAYVNRALRDGTRLLAEGGQATLLDLDHGNYPYVTSSNATAGGALVGLGFGPTQVDRVVGVAKAFCTRVGAGPFPTEQDNDIGGLMRGDGSQPWDDFGTTTGRPRRCGWLDMVALSYAVEVNGMTELALMKLDVLSRFDEIKAAVQYKIDGKASEDFPIEQGAFQRATPVYRSFPGWRDDIMAVNRYDKLPAAAREYVEWIESQIGIPISQVSIGPGREQTLLRG
jgi:adenylosuccinate synthase